MKPVWIFFSILLFLTLSAQATHRNTKTKGTKAVYQTLTGDDIDSDKAKWDLLYQKHQDEYLFGKEPARFLVDIRSSLPKTGLVLDLAMGEGRNAVYMANQGYSVVGVDISELAIRKAKRLAKERSTKIKTVVSDINHFKIESEKYDVILVFYYLQRSLIPRLIAGLKKGGMLVFENYTVDHLKYDKTFEREYLLKRNELSKLFESPDLKIVKAQETDNGKEAYSSIVLEKI